MALISALGLAALLIAAVLPVHAAVYYLSPEGDDAHVGTREAPWRTIEKANEALAPGDTAVFLPGEYAGTIAPADSGAQGAPIAYRSEQPWQARLVGETGQWLIELGNRQHITIDGFRLDGRGRAGWFTADASRHVTIRGCEMRHARPLHYIRRAEQLKLLDNVFSKDTVGGDTFHLVECSRVLIEGNSFTRVGHCPLILSQATHVVVRANVFRAEWGRNYSFWSSGRLLVDGNIITRARDSAWSADSKAKNLYDDSIFRHNRVFDNLHTPTNTSSYIWQGVGPTNPLYRWPFVAVNSRFYHNTITDNLGHGWELNGINVSANVFQNNIFHRNDYAGGNVQIWRGDGISRDNRFVSNLLRGTEPGQAVVRYANDHWTAEEANRRTLTTGGFWSEFHANIDADPGFIDADNRDYRLGPESAAIDAGEPLARAVGSGTGRALPVNDGVPFYDGFGIEGEQGDFIAVGRGDNLARIERVELRYYQPAILHLDREVTWDDAMPVSLPWAGDEPDIGAFQRGVTDPTRIIALARPAVATPGEPVQFSLDTLGKEPETVTWDFEDGARSHEPAPAHTYATAGHYGVTVRATFPDGRRSVDAVFIKVEEQADHGTPLVAVDFEDATLGTEWGWYLKFYRGHQTGAERIQRPAGGVKGMCMRIFYDARKRNQTAAQIAPGAWDIDRHPLVRFSYIIPEGVPVAIEITPFPAPDRPGGVTLGGTASRATRHRDLDAYALVDDGRWREITIDVRRVREVIPDLKILRQFMFYTDWREDRGQQMWLDDFAILPE